MVGWLKNRFWPRLKRSVENWQEDDGFILSASVGYYAALALFPMLLILIAGLGFLLQLTEIGKDAEQQVLAAIGEYASPTLEQDVKRMLNQVQDQAPLGGPMGILVLLVTAGTLFVNFQSAFDKIWNVHDPESRGIIGAIKSLLFYRLKAFFMLLGVGVLIFLTFIAGLLLSMVEGFAEDALPTPPWTWRTVQIMASLVLNTMLFSVIYRYVPRVPVRWSEALQGGLVAGIIWEGGRQLLSAFLIGDRYTSAYGVVGSMIALMLWVYYASAVLFLGAEYVQVVCEECRTQKPGEKRVK